jgi:hypothetical protein
VKFINPVHGTAGCARCRMDLIRFVVEVKLPRFTMHAGDTWNLPQTQHREHGIEAGHGFAPTHTFVIIERDHVRASHNGARCQGTALESYPDALPELVGATE